MDGTTAGYDATRAHWAADSEAYWMAAAAALDWHRPPSRAFFPRGPARGTGKVTFPVRSLR